jgi:ribonuclease-3 family protein
MDNITINDKKAILEQVSMITEKIEQPRDVRQIPALTLAYLGDGIYELIIRTTLVEQGMSHVDSLNKKASGYAKAPTQAKIFHIIEPELTEEELACYKRGRNAKSGSVAKSGTVMDYRTATGFEAMLGFLYLEGRLDRIMELVDHGIKGLEGQDQ